MNIFSGVDIIEIDRIKKSIQNKRFLARIYTPAEIDLYHKRNCSISFLAGNFAAKEALAKCLGSGVRGFWFDDIEVLRDNLGAPYFNFYGNLKPIVEENKLRFSLSISNEKKYAIAFVVAYK